MNNICTCSATVLLQDLMPLVTSKDICPETQLTQYYQSWWLGHETTLTAQQNTVGHRKKGSKGTTHISSSNWRSSTISQLNGGWFSQERRPEIKFLYQRVEALKCNQKWNAHIHTKDETTWYLNYVRFPQREQYCATTGFTKTEEKGHPKSN